MSNNGLELPKLQPFASDNAISVKETAAIIKAWFTANAYQVGNRQVLVKQPVWWLNPTMQSSTLCIGDCSGHHTLQFACVVPIIERIDGIYIDLLIWQHINTAGKLLIGFSLIASKLTIPQGNYLPHDTNTKAIDTIKHLPADFPKMIKR